MANVAVRVDPEIFKAVGKLAKVHKLETGEEVDRLLRMGISRHNALFKYAQKPRKSSKKGRKAK